ncbi:hypothetical protein ABZS66_00980 [Dactylosporangium sp. NPDC005572]
MFAVDGDSPEHAACIVVTRSADNGTYHDERYGRKRSSNCTT